MKKTHETPEFYFVCIEEVNEVFASATRPDPPHQNDFGGTSGGTSETQTDVAASYDDGGNIGDTGGW